MTVNVYHKHSVVKSKQPDAKQIELGEIAINANQDSPALYIKDSADRVIQIGGDITQIIQDIQDLHDLIDGLNQILPNPIDGGTNLIQLLSELGDLKAQVELNAQCCTQNHIDIVELEKELKELNLFLEQQLENIKKALAALEAQILLSAQHNAEQDRQILAIQNELAAITLRIDTLAKDVDDLKKVKVTAGKGIVVKESGKYQFKVSIDKDWLDDYIQDVIDKQIEPYYAKINLRGNTSDLP